MEREVTPMLPVWFWDIITIALIVVCAVASYRNGFLRSFVAFIGTAVAFIAAIMMSEPLAVNTYDTMLEEKVITAVEESVEEYGIDGVETVLEKTDVLIEMLPASIANAVDTKITDKLIEEKYLEFMEENGGNISAALSEKIVEPIVTGTIQILIFCLIFIVGGMIMKLLSRLVGGVRYVPLFGSLDRALGGVFGLIQGMLYVFVLAAVLWLLIQITNDGLPFATQAAAGETMLFGRFFKAVSDIADPL